MAGGEGASARRWHTWHLSRGARYARFGVWCGRRPVAHDGGRITFAEVVPQRLHWLWRGRIPLGALTLLEGDPGLGKALLTIDLIARLTTGRLMPASSETLETPKEDEPALTGGLALSGRLTTAVRRCYPDGNNKTVTAKGITRHE